MEVNIFEQAAVLIFAKTAVLIILTFYVIFSLLIIRQVDLMGKTLITGTSKILRVVAIIHVGFALGLIVLAWRIL